MSRTSQRLAPRPPTTPSLTRSSRTSSAPATPRNVSESRERIAQAINDGDWGDYLSDMVDTGARAVEYGAVLTQS
jgi:hypothetical protein